MNPTSKRAAVKRLDRIARREYETADKRFHVTWVEAQGCSSFWRVHDRQGGNSVRTRRLDEVHEAIREMREEARK